MNKIKLLLVLTSCLLMAACANVGNKSVKDITKEEVASSIVVSQSTASQIESRFGSPFESTYTDGGLMIWKYRYDDTTALTAETIGSTVLTLGLAGVKTKGTRTELVILFDENDIVKKFNLSNSPIEAGTGIF
tara:strand:+ start:669 stop:1067 length:399 start_codon:yes stop_codon:yes gene_type:complete